MTGRRRTLVWIGAALAGLVVAAGLTTAAAQLSNQSVGLSSEPVTAGDELAPAASPTRTAKPRPTRTPTPRPTRTPTRTPPPPAQTAAPTADNHGGGGSGGDDSSGRGRGRGRGGGDD